VHSFCATLGPTSYELMECTLSPCSKWSTAWRVGVSWIASKHWRYDAPAACQLGELDLDSISPMLDQHSTPAEATSEDPYRCAALDEEAAAMADWTSRDAHEFALGASLGFAALMDTGVALGLFLYGLGSLQSDSVTRFIFAISGAFISMLTAYFLFVAARWLPPAIQCRCVTLVPSALSRLLSLIACLAYTTASFHLAVNSGFEARLLLGPFLEAYRVTGEVPLPSPELALDCGVCVTEVTQMLLHFFASFIVVHRLWLQTAEDDRPWIAVTGPRPSRTSRVGLKGLV